MAPFAVGVVTPGRVPFDSRARSTIPERHARIADNAPGVDGERRRQDPESEVWADGSHGDRSTSDVFPRLDANLYACHPRSVITHLEPGRAVMRLCVAVTRAGPGEPGAGGGGLRTIGGWALGLEGDG